MFVVDILLDIGPKSNDLGTNLAFPQGFGSGSGLDPDSIRSVETYPDPDPGGQK